MKRFAQAGNYWLVNITPAAEKRGQKLEWSVGRDQKTGKPLKIEPQEQYIEIECASQDENEQRQLQAKTEDRILSLFNDIDRVYVTQRGWQRNASVTKANAFVLTNIISAFELDKDGNVRDLDWFDELDFK